MKSLRSMLWFGLVLLSLTASSFPGFAKAHSTVRNTYIVFEDRQDFEHYLRKSFPRNSAKLLPSADKKYERANSILENVWNGFKSRSFERTKELHRPQIALLAHDQMDAYVTQDSATKLVPNAVFLYARVLELPDHEIAALFAHELTHLLHPDFKARYYEVSKGNEPLGFLQPNNSEVEKIVKQWQSITELIGPQHLPELNGLPLPIAYDGKLFNILQLMALEWGDPNKMECQSVQASLPPWRADLVFKYFSSTDQTFRLTDAQKSTLSEQTQEYILELRACLGHIRASLIPTLAKLLHESENAISAKYLEQARTFDVEPNVVDGIFAITREETKKLNEFQTKHNLDNYRIYSHEEFADDEAVRVLELTPYSPQSMGQFFLSLMAGFHPEDRDVCEKLLNSKKVPPYGMISDPHHSLCFRAYHAFEMAR